MTESLAEGSRRLARFLGEWRHGSAVIGGMAMVARVRIRPTRDIDVVLGIPEGRLEELLEAVQRHGYRCDVTTRPGRELAEAGLVRLDGPGEAGSSVGVDLIAVDSPFLERVIGRATPIAIPGGATLPVATVEDLLLLKLEANRPIDIDDALAIKDAFADVLDMEYVRAGAVELGVTPTLELLFDGHF